MGASLDAQPLLEARIESLLIRASKPSRYVGGEVNSVRKEQATGRVVLTYPDAYEVGISNQALQILYSLINERSGAFAERAYCPWPDMADLMREEDVPLFSLETWRPVRDADLWGITLQHELTYTNVLECLDLAGVPIHAVDRGEDDPIVMAGGPCVSNPAPVLPFFDVIFVGEAEEKLLALVDTVVAGRREGLSRADIVRHLAGLDGVLVPNREPLGPQPYVRRAVFADFAASTVPTRPIVPFNAAVFDRASVEVMRGCTRGCRFCHAGTWYRPVRERSSRDVVDLACQTIEQSGYDELTLTSLASSDYSGVRAAITGLQERMPQVQLSLPSLRADSAGMSLSLMTQPRKGGVTLAPEAGTERLRWIINKDITDADLEGAARTAFESGYGSLKMYFMIGIPHETDEDLLGIVRIGGRMYELGRTILAEKGLGRPRINVSCSNFVPKPHTPFQFARQATREELAHKQRLLRAHMPRHIKLSLHDADGSVLEGAMSRIGPEGATVVEAAWRAGARFDEWTEQLDRDAWDVGFAAVGTTVEAAAQVAFGEDDPLPWDHVDSGVTRDFLWQEWLNAHDGEFTPDCRWDLCTDCGACGGLVQTRLRT